MNHVLLVGSFLFILSACVETSVQPMTQTSFKVSTEAEDLCGAKTTREIAFKSAAVEVIRRGADRFIVVGDQADSRITGGTFTHFGGFQTYGSNTQDMIIQIVKKGDHRFADSLSAKQVLGPEWEQIVATDAKQTCF